TPLEKDNSAEFRQREARAAQLAKEIESSPQYRVRISMENDDGRTEEERFSAVQRPPSERDSPNVNSREGKYIPLPQRSREGVTRGGGGLRSSVARGGRVGSGSLPPRGGLHHPEANSNPSSEQRVINGGASRMSPKSQRPTRGGKPLMGRGGPISEVSTHSPAAGVNRPYHPRSPKPALAAQDLPASAPSPTSPPEARSQPPPPAAGSLDSTGSSSPKPAAAAPLFTDGKHLAGTTGKDLARPSEISSPGALEYSKAAGK
ncbi:ataxin-2-like protein, partial [Mustelus asterias]